MWYWGGISVEIFTITGRTFMNDMRPLVCGMMESIKTHSISLKGDQFFDPTTLVHTHWLIPVSNLSKRCSVCSWRRMWCVWRNSGKRRAMNVKCWALNSHEKLYWRLHENHFSMKEYEQLRIHTVFKWIYERNMEKMKKFQKVFTLDYKTPELNMKFDIFSLSLLFCLYPNASIEGP